MIIACIPAYNEEKTIARVVLLAQREVDKVVVCDDGSKDLTADIAEALGAKVISHAKNLGKGAALRSLFGFSREIGADVVVTLDGDGQHDPNEISELIRPIQNGGADVVIGTRFNGDISLMPRYRQVGNRLLNFFTNAAAKGNMTDTQSGYRAYSRKALKEIKINENSIGVDSQIIMDAKEKGLKIVECPIACTYGVGGSTYNPIRHTADVIVSLIRVVTEKRPFTYLGVPGATLLFIGMSLGVLVLNTYLTMGEFNMITAVFAMGSLLAGLLLAFTAIILNAISSLRS